MGNTISYRGPDYEGYLISQKLSIWCKNLENERIYILR